MRPRGQPAQAQHAGTAHAALLTSHHGWQAHTEGVQRAAVTFSTSTKRAQGNSDLLPYVCVCVCVCVCVAVRV